MICVQATCALIHDCDLNNNCQVSRISFLFEDNDESCQDEVQKKGKRDARYKDKNSIRWIQIIQIHLIVDSIALTECTQEA